MVKAVLFDLDGTLVDTLADLADATNAVLERHNLPTHGYDAYRQFIGNGARLLVERAAGEEAKELHAVMLEEFVEEYNRRCLDKTRPYDGVLKTLDVLTNAGILLGVVTNKPHGLAVKLVDHLFDGRFGCVFGGSTAYPKKPDPQSALLAAQALGVDIDECVFVGDSNVDVFTAHAAGIPCIGCAFGFRGEEELLTAGADSIAYSFTELQKNGLIFD